MATGLKVLGIESFRGKPFLVSLVSLVLFGFGVNGLYDLYKLLPTLFLEGPKVLDYESLIVFGAPVLVAAIWVSGLYFNYP